MTDLRKAAEMALEALELSHPRFGLATEKYKQAIKALYQALEKDADEWYEKALWGAEQETVECMCGLCKLGKREWVGLTDADIAKTMHGSVEGSNMLPYQFARAIEQALKENNGG